MFGKNWCVICGNAEANSSTDVTKDCVADGFSHLASVLVCNGEVETVFAGLRENDCEGIGCEVLELIYVEIEWAAIFDVCNIRAAHCGELDLGDEEGAKNSGVIFADKSFGEVDDKNFAFVHDFTNIKARLWLTNNITNDWVCREGTNLV